MSIVNPDIGKPLVHHEHDHINSRLLDFGLGLTWRNETPEGLMSWASFWEHHSRPDFSNMLLNAAILKENAIKNGINLEDKL